MLHWPADDAIMISSRDNGREIMKLNSVHHIAIIGTNYERSYDFYVNKLGFKVVYDIERPHRNDRVIYLEVNEDTGIELFIMPDPPKRVTYPEACGLRHLCFRVDSVPEAIEWLAGRGIQCDPMFLDTNNNANKPVVFFWDPDGTPLELHE